MTIDLFRLKGVLNLAVGPSWTDKIMIHVPGYINSRDKLATNGMLYASVSMYSANSGAGDTHYMCNTHCV